MTIRLAFITVIFILGSMFNLAGAAFNLKQFDDPKHAARYEQLIYQMRCLVCQNQTIADSDADLAKDLRNEIFKMIESGKSDQEIIDFMVARYGEFVLYKPRVEKKTLLLWAGPAILLILALIILVWTIFRRKRGKQPTVEQNALNKARSILKDNEQ